MVRGFPLGLLLTGLTFRTEKMVKPRFSGEKQVIEHTATVVSEAVVQPSSLAESSTSTASLDTLPERGSEIEPETASMMDFSQLKPCFDQVLPELFLSPVIVVLRRFLQHLEAGLPGVSFVWQDIFNDPFSSKLLDASHIPQPVYTDLGKWVNLLMEDEEVGDYVLWMFNYIVDSVYDPLSMDGVKRFQNVTLFLALAMILRTRPHVLFRERDLLMKEQVQYKRRDILATPLTVWMTNQVSQTDLGLGLHSWVLYLLPLLLDCNPHSTCHTQSTELILQVAEKIMADPEAQTIAKSPYWQGFQLIPPPSIEHLLQFRFPATPAREEDTARVERIYTWFKDMALTSALERNDVIQQIFTVSLGSVGKGNPVLAKEAAAIALWSLTENDVCWEHWNSLCKDNLRASVDLLITLVEKWNDHSLEPSSPSRKAMEHHEFIQRIFNVSLRLTGNGYSVLAKEAAEIAIWSLTKNIDCWKRWDYLYKENMEASVVLLRELEEKWNEHSLKLLSSPSDFLTLSHTLKSFRLKNKKNKGFLYKEVDHYCKAILRRLSRGSSCLKGTCITVVVLVTAVAAATLVLP